MEQVLGDTVENPSRISHVRPVPKWYRVYENKMHGFVDALIAVDDGDAKNVVFCYKVINASTKPSYTSTYLDAPVNGIEPKMWMLIYGVLKSSRDHAGRVVLTIIRASELA